MRFRIINLLFMLMLTWSLAAYSARLTPEAVPEPLKPWVNWVMQQDNQQQCPFMYNQYEQKICEWPGQLNLELTQTTGHFAGFWQLAREGWLILPGDDSIWPQNVQVSVVSPTGVKSPLTASVIAKDQLPAIWLKPGRYDIQGAFHWDYLPEQLRIPEQSGLLRLRIHDLQIEHPQLKAGLLWLKAADASAAALGKAEDKLDLQVFRQIIDDVPLQVLSRLELDVAGAVREIKLPQALLQGTLPMRLDSPLPARFEADGQLLLQVRPGHWQINLLARQVDAADTINLKAIPTWPAQEIWVVSAQPALRIVEVVGLNALDPSQTNLPADWQHLPAYRINAGQALQFKVIRRGNPDPEANKLTLSRQLWLDFDGQGYTASDAITGSMRRDWRLNTLEELHLGKVSLNGENQLITRADKGDSGFEVRQGEVQVQADSRIEGKISPISVSGWQQTFENVSADVHLPPGWGVLAVSGVDNVPDTWLSRWTLLDLLLVFLTALVIKQLYSIQWGLLAGLTLILIWHEPDAPTYSWLNVLAVLALLQWLPTGKLATALHNYLRLAQLALIIITLPFLLWQIRTALYPQLSMPWQAPIAMSEMSGAVSVPASPVAEVADSLSAAPERLMKKSERAEMQANSADSYRYAENKILPEHDPLANVQTGPGLPQWQWRRIHLAWTGAVDSQQAMHIYYLSPAMNAGLNLLRVLLVLALVLLLIGQWPKLPKRPQTDHSQGQPNLALLFSGSGLLLWLAVAMALPQRAKADFPPPAVLEELKTRLSEAPACLPTCAQIGSARIDISAEQLQIILQVDAAETVAVPLPAQQQQWLPQQVNLDGADQVPLMRDAEGQLWLQLTPGRHELVLQGKTPALDKFALALPLKPHFTQISAKGWDVVGLHEQGQVDSPLQFTRTATLANMPGIVPSSLPPYFSVQRNLQLGLDWRVHNQILRLSPADAAVVLKIPLLPGESVVTPGLRVEQNQVLISLAAADTQATWDSVLAKSPELMLSAPKQGQWSELWRVTVSPVWHLDSEGLLPIHPEQASAWQPVWRPWPGEAVNLHLTRPQAQAGQTLTIDYSKLSLSPGKRITDAHLLVKVKSSKGGQHEVSLPPNVDLQSVSIDGALQAIRPQGQTVTLPLKPGEQTWDLHWQVAQGFTHNLQSPSVNLGAASVNSHIQMQLSEDRWLLFAFGPTLGPAVLFWGYLVLLIILAYGLAKANFAPLRTWQWLLLLIGLSQVSIVEALLVVAWFMAMAWRQHSKIDSAKRFNLLQVALCALTFIAGCCLFWAVQRGLLGWPDMQISGNQSNAQTLNWYQDRSAAQLPQVRIISVPLLVYRGLMLCWSLWLAAALLQWLKWGWQCYAAGGIWQKLPPKPAKKEGT